MSSKMFLTKERANLLVFGYNRQERRPMNTEIPTSLIELIFIWFYEAFKVLQFSDKYCTKDIFTFEDDRTTIVKEESYGHRYICVDTEPLFTGMHCFRVQFNCRSDHWISFGVSECADVGDKSYRADNC